MISHTSSYAIYSSTVGYYGFIMLHLQTANQCKVLVVIQIQLMSATSFVFWEKQVFYLVSACGLDYIIIKVKKRQTNSLSHNIIASLKSIIKLRNLISSYKLFREIQAFVLLQCQLQGYNLLAPSLPAGFHVFCLIPT